MKIKKNNDLILKDRWFTHSKQRAMERYGISYTKSLLQVVQKDFSDNVFNVMLEIPNTSRVVLRGRILDKVVTFIYETTHHAVITFLHNSWVSGDSSEFLILSYKTRKGNSSKRLGKSKRLNKQGKVKLNAKILRKLKSPVRHKLLNRRSSKEHIAEQFETMEDL